MTFSDDKPKVQHMISVFPRLTSVIAATCVQYLPPLFVDVFTHVVPTRLSYFRGLKYNVDNYIQSVKYNQH